MIKKQYAVPGLLIGFAMIGGTTAYAFGGGFPLEAFENFTADEKAAISKAEDIRTKAHEEAQAVLEAAGVTQEELREAMQEFHESHKEAMHEALANNDYAAFTELMANSPMADELTEEVFAKLVEIHELEASGDKEGAQALRQELRDAGFQGGMGFGKGGHRGMMAPDSVDAQ